MNQSNLSGLELLETYLILLHQRMQIYRSREFTVKSEKIFQFLWASWSAKSNTKKTHQIESLFVDYRPLLERSLAIGKYVSLRVEGAQDMDMSNLLLEAIEQCRTPSLIDRLSYSERKRKSPMTTTSVWGDEGILDTEIRKDHFWNMAEYDKLRKENGLFCC